MGSPSLPIVVLLACLQNWSLVAPSVTRRGKAGLTNRRVSSPREGGCALVSGLQGENKDATGLMTAGRAFRDTVSQSTGTTGLSLPREPNRDFYYNIQASPLMLGSSHKNLIT